jgi:hypothetical protein
MNDQNSSDILLEDINHKLAAILEGQASLAGVPAQLQQIDNRLMSLEGDVKVVKAAITDFSQEQQAHGARLDRLETA